MWLFIVITSYFLNAVVSLIDKIILSKAVLKPLSYAFYVGLVGGFAVLLVPFSKTTPTLEAIIIGGAAGIFLVIAVYLFLRALSRHEASRIVPAVGGLVPIFTFFLSFFLLQERLPAFQIIAFILLVVGGILISVEKKEEGYTAKAIMDGALAAFFFAAGFTLTKDVFLKTTFINGYIITRMGSFFCVLLFLLIPYFRKLIWEDTRCVFEAKKSVSKNTLPLFILSKVSSTLATVGIDVAIYLSSVTLVNAMQGVQYAFLFLLSLILSRKYPRFIKEGSSWRLIFQKTIAIMLISAGLLLLII